MDNKIEGKFLKKANTYISNMLTDSEKKELDINLSFHHDYLTFFIIYGDVFFGYKIKTEVPMNKTYKLKYIDLKNAFKSIKIKDMITFILEDNSIEIKNINGETISSLKAESVDLLDLNKFKLNTDSFIEFYANSFYESIKINKIIAKKNDVNFCDKIYFKINDIYMSIFNMDNNTCIINSLSIINEEHKEFNFSISNEDISLINKWNKNVQDNKSEKKTIKLNIENGYLVIQSLFEFFRIKISQDIIDSLSETIQKIDYLKFDVLNSKTIKDISATVINDTKLLSDIDENYKLDNNIFSEDTPIVVNKQSFLNIIKGVNEMSNIGLAVNSIYTPIIINYMDGYLRTKIIFNIIK